MGSTTATRAVAPPVVRRLVTVAAATLALTAVAPAPAQAAVATTPDPTVKVGGGGVHAVARGETHTYLGGLFSSVGVQLRSNVAAVTADGKVDPQFDPGTNGKVNAIAVSENGATVFLGGTFTQVDGVARTGLAAVDATTGEVRPNWEANTAGATVEVASLAVEGDRLYVGGRFTSIDGAARPRLAAVTVDTGEVLLDFRPRPVGGVREVAVSPGDGNVYVGGGLTALGGQPRAAAGAVDPVTGAVTSFSPTGDGGNAVTVDVGPDGWFYYGTENNTLFAYDPAASNDPQWSLKTSGNTQAIEVVDDEMWIGGHFSQIVTGKIPRPFLASIDPGTGTVNGWDSQCTGGKQGVWALLHDGADLHVGGYFAAFGPVKQRGYARFSVTP